MEERALYAASRTEGKSVSSKLNMQDPILGRADADSAAAEGSTSSAMKAEEKTVRRAVSSGGAAFPRGQQTAAEEDSSFTGFTEGESVQSADKEPEWDPDQESPYDQYAEEAEEEPEWDSDQESPYDQYAEDAGEEPEWDPDQKPPYDEYAEDAEEEPEWDPDQEEPLYTESVEDTEEGASGTLDAEEEIFSPEGAEEDISEHPGAAERESISPERAEESLPEDRGAAAEEDLSAEHADDEELYSEGQKKKRSSVRRRKKNRSRQDNVPYSEKLRKHRRSVYRRSVALVLLFTAALIFGVVLWMRRGYTRAEFIRIASLKEEDGTAYENLGGNVVQYGMDGASCMDRRGNILWTVPYEISQPITSVSGSVIAIGGRGSYDVYVMNTKGLLGNIHTILPVENIAVSENGEVAVIMNDSKTSWVRLYTPEGREIAYIIRTMEENGYPIAAAVSPDGRTLCLSSVRMSSADVKTDVSFYNFGKEGQKMSDHLVGNSEYMGQVVPFVCYLDNSVCVCVSDKGLYLHRRKLLGPPVGSGKMNDQNLKDFENIQGVFAGEGFVGILTLNSKESSRYSLSLFNKRGKKVGVVQFSLPYKDVVIAGGKVYIYNENTCRICTVGGRRLFEGNFPRPIRALIPGADLNDLMVVTAGELSRVRLQ